MLESGSDDVRRIEVVGAVIVRDGLVLCTRRGPGDLEGSWEFPGGKREPDESATDALVREIREELGCLVTVGERVLTTEHEYEAFAVALTTFYCTLAEGEPTLSEHTEAAWLPPERLAELDWAPADLSAVAEVRRLLTGAGVAGTAS